MEPELLDVPVAGGALWVARWGGAGPAVVAVHGITASHAAWRAVANGLEGVVLLAPDLRGRGGSATLDGSGGIAGHADDLVAVLDRLDVERAVVVGHSMGGYVAAVLAARRHERVSALVLADGGLPLPVPPLVDPDALLEAALGPAFARLRMTFPSRAAYRAFWRAHPAFAAPEAWSEDVEAYFDYDLTGEPPLLRSRTSEAVARADGRDVLTNDGLRSALADISCPVTLLRAPRGMLDEPVPLIPDSVVADARRLLPQLVDELVQGTNHYTLVMGRAGAAVVAERVLAAARGA